MYILISFKKSLKPEAVSDELINTILFIIIILINFLLSAVNES